MKNKIEVIKAQSATIQPYLLFKGLGFFIALFFLSSSAWAALEGSASGLMAWWTFDDGKSNSSATTAQDSTGNGNTGSLAGSPLPLWVAGKLGDALNFSNGGSVTTPLAISTAPLTECAWIYPTSTGANGNYIINSGSFQFSTLGYGNNTVQVYNGVNAAYTANGVITMGAWQHVCVTMDTANNILFYINGTNVASVGNSNIGPIPYSHNVSIGGGFPGLIDDARVYNRVLSASEVSNLYNEGLSGGPTTTFILTLINSGSGSIVSNPTGIACPSTCSASYIVGTVVQLTAVPPTGYITSWSNCGSTTGGNTCTVGMDADTSITASYTAIPPAPVITSVAVSSITGSSAVITWNTDQLSNSQVNYGLTSAYGQQTTLADTNPMVTAHTVTLSNLQPSTTYHFQIDSQNAYAILGTSTDQTFSTPVPGPAAPLYVSAKGVSADQINIVWYLPPDSTGTVNSYTVYRDGSAIATVTPQTFYPQSSQTGQGLYEDQGLSPNSSHTYFLIAHDSAGYTSPQSVNVTASTISGTTSLIPPDRLIDWTPGVSVGVPGGIPTMPSPGGNIIDVTKSPYNADNTDTNDASTAIQAAMNAAHPGDVVYLPAGMYRISSTLGGAWFYLNPPNNVVLRGAGPESTILDCRAGTCIALGSNTFGNSSTTAMVTGGLTQGSSVLTVSSTNNFVVGGIARIFPSNDTSLPVIGVSGPFPGGRTQLVRVTAINPANSTLTVHPSLYTDYSSSKTVTITGAPTFFEPTQPSQGNFLGIENLTVDGSKSAGAMTWGIAMGQIYGAWINNVVVNDAANYGISFGDCLNCEMRHTTITGPGVAASNHSGLLFMIDNTGCLIEDNIITNSFPAMEINAGSSGNVFGYNFISSASGGNIDMNHDPHNDFNLYEGNITLNYDEADGYFGSVSNDIFFRNWMPGGIALKRFTRNYSIIGNIITPWYSLGEPNIGNSSTTGFAEASQGLYWKDWNPTIGPTILGTVQSVSGTTVTFSMNNSADAQRLWSYMTFGWCNNYTDVTLPNCGFPLGVDWGQGQDPAKFASSTEQVFNLSTNTLVVNLASATNVPSVGTVAGFWPRSEGFQELDMDVALTTIFKDNYNTILGVIPSYETLPNTEILPNSMYRTSAPSWFGSLTWPPFNPSNPPANGSTNYDQIPAGYRYDHPGQDTPGLGTINYGDVNNDGIVNMADAEMTAQAAIGLIPLSSTQLQAAEVDGTGKLSIYDAYLIAEYAVGLITKFPVQGGS